MSALIQSFSSLSLSSRSLRGDARVASAMPMKKRTAVVTEAKKKWEKQALNQNGKPLRVKMHVKTNDKVIVIAGADKGKVTEVVEVFTKNGQILCKDVNIKTKHVKPRNEGESGSIIQREFPIHHSNVMHYSAAEKKRSRVGKKMEGDKKVRVLKATGEVLAN